jgi:hypothetical protein
MIQKLEDFLSAPMCASIRKKIANQKKYATDGATGEVIPFVFKLTGTGEPDPTTNRKNGKAPLALGRDALINIPIEIYDPWNKGSKYITLENITGYETSYIDDVLNPGQKKAFQKPKVEPIVFEKGILRVPIEREILLAIMMLAHNNIGKPKDMAAKDKMIQHFTWHEDKHSMYVGTTVNKVDEIQLMARAIQYAGTYTMDQKREVLFTVSKDPRFKQYDPTNRTYEAIDNDIFVLAKEHPRDFLHANVKEDIKVELAVFDGISRKMIVHDVENGKYSVVTLGGERPLYKYQKATETAPERALIKHLLHPDNASKKAWILGLTKPQSHPYMPEEETVEPKEEAIAA